MRKLLFAAAVVLALTPVVNRPGLAGEYPTRPVRIFVPASPGGVTDVVARMTADYLSNKTHERFVVENKSGAGGNLATEAVAHAAPDGYTIGLVASGNIVINPYLYKHMPFDAKDLIPVASIAEAPQVLAVNKDVPAKSLKDLIALAKAHPGSLKYASAGVGTTMHLAGDEFAHLAGISLVHVPYRGAAPAVTDVVANVVQIIPVSAGPIMGFVRSGGLRVLAAATPKRLKYFPDVPTTAEAGLPGFQMTTWFGMVVPSGTPQPIIQKLHDIVAEMLQDAAAQKRLDSLFLDRMPMSQPQFAAYVTAEFPKWKRIVGESGLQPN